MEWRGNGKLLQIALLDTDHYPIVLTLLSFHDHFRNPNTTQNNKIHANPIPTCNGKKDFQPDPTWKLVFDLSKIDLPEMMQVSNPYFYIMLLPTLHILWHIKPWHTNFFRYSLKKKHIKLLWLLVNFTKAKAYKVKNKTWK